MQLIKGNQKNDFHPLISFDLRMYDLEDMRHLIKHHKIQTFSWEITPDVSPLMTPLSGKSTFNPSIPVTRKRSEDKENISNTKTERKDLKSAEKFMGCNCKST